jgi:DeoR family galactitol utilization operon repressor
MAENQSERKVLESLLEDSSVSVTDLSRKLDVSTVSVRSVLENLEQKGLIVRTRGGAVSAFHPSIVARQRHMVDEKKKIAEAAAGLVKDGDTIMIEAGTTTALIVKYLLGKRDVHVVTNSMLVLPYARISPSLHLTVVGGEFRPSTESLVGPVSLEELARFHVGFAFVGTDGFSLESGLTAHHVEGAEIVRKMAAQSDKSVLVADSSKHGRAGFVHVLPLSGLSMIVTDGGLAAEKVHELEKGGIKVCVADGAGRTG